ncbi:hypothetical protein Bca4012_094533 [Brassica carinata]
MLTFPLCGCELSSESKTLAFAAPLISISHTKRQIVLGRRDSVKVPAAKSGNFSLGSFFKVVRVCDENKQIFKSCDTCGAKGAIECPGCKCETRKWLNGQDTTREDQEETETPSPNWPTLSIQLSN